MIFQLWTTWGHLEDGQVNAKPQWRKVRRVGGDGGNRASEVPRTQAPRKGDAEVTGTGCEAEGGKESRKDVIKHVDPRSACK